MFKFYRQWKLCGRHRSKQFAWDMCLSHSALEQIDGMCKQFHRALRDIQFVDNSYNFDRNLGAMNHPLDENSGSHRLVKAILTAGLYPNVVKVKMPRKKYHKTITGAQEQDPDDGTIRFFLNPKIQTVSMDLQNE